MKNKIKNEKMGLNNDFLDFEGSLVFFSSSSSSDFLRIWSNGIR